MEQWAEATRSYLTLNIEEQLSQSSTARPRQVPAQLELFDEAALAEFGITFTRLAEVVGEILAIGEDQASPAKSLALREFRSRLGSVGVTEQEVVGILSRFSLRERARFLEPDPPATRNDVYPWRFNRALSYIRRPLLVVTTDGDEHVMWGNRHLLDFFDNLVGLCLHGRLKADTPAMARAMGARADLAGRTFSHSVADVLDSRPEFLVRRHVKKVSGLRLARQNGEPIGDVDILAVDTMRRSVWAIEAKNLAVARTPHEIRNEIDEIVGPSPASPGSVRRHLERTEWLEANLGHVLKSFNVMSDLRRWRVRSLVVTESDLLSASLAPAGIPVISFRRFAEMVSRDPGLLSRVSG
jgi:hypothetical protein